MRIKRLEEKYKDIDPLLGTMPDNKVAEKTGVSASAIWERRDALGVPPFCKRGKRGKRPLVNHEIQNLLGGWKCAP